MNKFILLLEERQIISSPSKKRYKAGCSQFLQLRLLCLYQSVVSRATEEKETIVQYILPFLNVEL